MTPEKINTATEQEMFEHYHFDVDKGQSLIRIDKFLSSKIVGISRNRIQNAANAGNILVNNKSVKSNYKTKPFDNISIVMSYPKNELELIAEDIPINIVYEDDDVLLVNKEAGMVVHPGISNYTGTLVNALMYYLKDLPLFKSGDQRPGLVHRIDKDTSGLLVIGKNEIAINKLAKQFFDKTTERKYYALVWGHLKEDTGTITGYIDRDPKNRTIRAIVPDESHGKHAITHYKVLERFGYTTLVECQLETGRTHQIRIHFQHIGHPLFNDASYGGDKILKGTTFTKYKQYIQNCFKTIPRQALHAKTLGFVHPTTGKKMIFESDLPEDFAQVLEKWRGYVNLNNPENAY